MNAQPAQNSKKLTKKKLKATAFRSKKKIKDILNDQVHPLPEEDEELELKEELKLKNPISHDSKLTSNKRKRNDTSTHLNPSHDHEESQQDTIVSTTASKRRKRKKASQLKANQSEETRRTSKLILFVGNLPFDITTDRLKTFFTENCAEEPSVRLITTKPSRPDEKPKTKGCGFIEFKSAAALQKALRLHHTPISCDPNFENENQKKTRKINVELTAGGGGKSEGRLKKIETSKLRLTKQREKILEKNLKSTTIEKNSNEGRLVHKDHSQFDVSIKLGSSKTHSKEPKAKIKPSLSGSNSIKLG